MLKYTRDEGECSLEMKGNVVELVSEVTYMIRVVHENLAKKEPGLAEAFRDMVTKCVTDERSPVWTDADSMRDVIAQKLSELADLLKGHKPESEEE